jgi:hypothetical protein
MNVTAVDELYVESAAGIAAVKFALAPALTDKLAQGVSSQTRAG